MPRSLLIHRVNQIKRVPRKMPLVGLRVNPDREKFRTQVPAPRLIQTDVPNIVRIGRSDVESFVEKSLRPVGMRADNNRRFLNSASLPADRRSRDVQGLARRWTRNRDTREQKNTEANHRNILFVGVILSAAVLQAEGKLALSEAEGDL